MQIVPQRLRKRRRELRLSRKALAQLSEVSEKQIQRLEDPKQASRNVRRETAVRLARELDVSVEDLMVGFSEAPGARTVRIGNRLRTGVSLAYELIERRYGVNAGELVNMAPLLFAVLAEGSLAWRHAELEKIQAAARELQQFDSNRTRFAPGHAANLLDDSAHEWAALKQPDLFDDPLPRDYRFEPDDKWDRNPFADYLRTLVSGLEPFWQAVSEAGGWPGRIRFEALDYTGTFGVSRVPEYSVCPDDLTEVAEPSSAALFALYVGDVRLGDIPDELRSESASEARQAWLEGMLSPVQREYLATVATLKAGGALVDKDESGAATMGTDDGGRDEA